MSAPSGQTPADELRKALDYHYREIIEGSGIDPAVALERGLFLEKTKAGLRRIGFAKHYQQRAPALVIPRVAPSGEDIEPVIKPGDPRMEKKKSGEEREIKYESIVGTPVRLSVHPRAVAMMRDIRHPLWITEGEKKGDAIVSRKGVAVVVQGVSAWNVPRDWEDVKLYGREVIIAYDADVTSNPNVMVEVEKLAGFLTGRGATVKYLKWPDKYRGTKKGVDDVLGAGEATLKDIYGWAQDVPDEDAVPVGIRLSDIEVRQIRWLWRARFPLAKVSVLDGDPGRGKSLILTDLAARITAGKPMPDGEPVERAGVVLVCAEDDASDTILPRFLAAGGDPTRAVIMGSDKPFVVPDDLPKLERAIRQVGASYVSIDPIMSFLSDDVNSSRDQDVRHALQPLVDIARRTGAAIIICRHLNKSSSSGQAIYRGQGSIGFIGIVRSGLMVGEHPERDDTFLLVGQKSNLSKPPESLAYSIAATPPDFEVPRIQWLGASEITVRQMTAVPDDEGERDRMVEAKEFLRDVLRAGPVPTKQLKKEASEADIAWRTVERAKAQLRVQAYKDGGSGRWMWILDRPTPEGEGEGKRNGHPSLHEDRHGGGDGGDGGLRNVSARPPSVAEMAVFDSPTTTTSTEEAYVREDRQDRQDRQVESGGVRNGGTGKDRQQHCQHVENGGVREDRQDHAGENVPSTDAREPSSASDHVSDLQARFRARRDKLRREQEGGGE